MNKKELVKHMKERRRIVFLRNKMIEERTKLNKNISRSTKELSNWDRYLVLEMKLK